MEPVNDEISHGTPLTQQDVSSYTIAPMLVFQIDKWRRAHGGGGGARYACSTMAAAAAARSFDSASSATRRMAST